MKGAAPIPVPLPQPTRERWQPLRIGLVELYHYDVEEFWFRDGHLLLRGNNGTGKSKVLSLTLPFLLDANLSASRVEPDGERSKRMEWNLLMNGRHPRRIGYTWMELGRRDPSGETQVLTLGCGLRAVAGRASVDTWFFLTEQRIGADLWLTTHEKTALSRDRLEEAIGSRGQVFTTAQAYRRAVDERVFCLGSERYAALVDTLIQLRQPQLSKQPDERRLSDALTDALPPLDRTAIEDVAEAMSQLDDIRRELEELQAMHRAVTTFVTRYRRYAQIATRRRARVLRQAQTEFDNTSHELNEAQAELEEARRQVAHWQEKQREREELVAADAARLTVLTQDPVMRDAARIADARRIAERSRQIAGEANEREEAARLRAEDEMRAAAERGETCGTTRANLLKSRRGAAAHATRGGVADAIEHALAGVQIPDGVLDAPGDFVTRLLHTTRGAESRRREQIGIVRQRLRALEAAMQSLARAQEARTVHADAFDSACEGLRTAIANLHSASTELLASSRHYRSTLHVLELPNLDEILEELEAWTESQSGPNPLRSALDRAWQTWQESTAQREAALVEQQKKLMTEQHVLRDEQVKLMRGEDRVPAVPYTRGADARLHRRGAPLWQLVDFEEHVPPESRAGLEAALEASGLLDAWVLPDGAVIDALTHDVMLVPRSPCTQPLRNWLIPTIPQSGHAAAVTSQTVAALLTSIACAVDEPPDVEAWLSPNGEFRVGTACGAWSKPRAEYIGHAAREAARRARLAVLAHDLAQIERMLAELDTTANQLSEARQTARSEYERAPADDNLQRAHARRAAQEQQ
ncbi:MAG: TIGR02680 family protein, partial [Steroidobacteraceae bacterium]